MKILALEFSTERRSVALLDAGQGGHAIIGQAAETTPRSIAPLALIDQALRVGGATSNQIDTIAIGLGPGSYAGIRGSISIAQGWQLVRNVQLIGVSSVDCLAAVARKQGTRGPTTVVLNAQRNELYLADYEISVDRCHEVVPLRIATVAEGRALPADGRSFIGPEVEKWFPGGTAVFPDGATLGQLAAGRTDFVSGEKLEPIYLRETDFVKAPPPRIIL